MSLFEATIGLMGSAETATLLAFGFLKVTILLGLALLARTLLSRAHPDRRHLLLRLALAAAVLLPLMSLAMATFNLHIFGGLLSAAAISIPNLVVATTSDGRLASEAVTGLQWTGYLILLWLAGTVTMLFRLGYGLALRSRILRRSRPFDLDAGLQLAHRLADKLAIRKPVRLAVSSAVGGPVAWSFPKSTVILPSASLTWGLGDLRLALVHEFNHIKRRDDVWMLVGALATALHWYNPLVWLVRDRLTLEADNVCDGCVVNSGADSTGYARFMLSMARQCSAIRTPVTIGSEIIGRKQLEVRIMSIQNGGINSQQVRRSLVRLAWVLALSISIPVAAVRLSDSGAAPDTSKKLGGGMSEQYPSSDSIVKVDVPPVMVRSEMPVYPDSARKVGLEGRVWVQVLIDKTGKVVDARIGKKSAHEGFDRAALEAAKKTIWKPAEQDGQKVSVWVYYEIKFSLKEKK